MEVLQLSQDERIAHGNAHGNAYGLWGPHCLGITSDAPMRHLCSRSVEVCIVDSLWQPLCRYFLDGLRSCEYESYPYGHELARLPLCIAPCIEVNYPCNAIKESILEAEQGALRVFRPLPFCFELSFPGLASVKCAILFHDNSVISTQTSAPKMYKCAGSHAPQDLDTSFSFLSWSIKAKAADQSRVLSNARHL